jgi:hypothetical protein
MSTSASSMTQHAVLVPLARHAMNPAKLAPSGFAERAGHNITAVEGGLQGG